MVILILSAVTSLRVRELEDHRVTCWRELDVFGLACFKYSPSLKITADADSVIIPTVPILCDGAELDARAQATSFNWLFQICPATFKIARDVQTEQVW